MNRLKSVVYHICFGFFASRLGILILVSRHERSSFAFLFLCSSSTHAYIQKWLAYGWFATLARWQTQGLCWSICVPGILAVSMQTALAVSASLQFLPFCLPLPAADVLLFLLLCYILRSCCREYWGFPLSFTEAFVIQCHWACLGLQQLFQFLPNDQEIVPVKPFVLRFLFYALLYSKGKCSAAKIASFGFENPQGKHKRSITVLQLIWFCGDLTNKLALYIAAHWQDHLWCIFVYCDKWNPLKTCDYMCAHSRETKIQA